MVFKKNGVHSLTVKHRIVDPAKRVQVSLGALVTSIHLPKPSV